MPALPAISTGSGTQAYAPLSDESYSPSLTITRTMPDARMSRLSSTSSLSSENGYLSTERVRSGSDDTLSASNNGKGKAINRLSGDSDFMSQRTPNIQVVRDEDEGDVGDYREKQRERERKGKMRADYGERQRPWDEEKGRVEDIYGGQGAYPPTNEEEEEEKRIQENLARMAARDMARRRASRLSRVISPSPHNTPDPNEAPGGFSSSTSYGRRPTSLMSLGSAGSGGSGGKRNSFMGLMDGIWPRSAGANGRDLERIDDAGELPLAHAQSRISPPLPSPNGYTNPYDSQQRTMPLSPISARSPFADPPSPSQPNHTRNASTATEQGFSYGGPGWRGGAGAAAAGAGAGAAVAAGQYAYQGEQKEKWWHALCAWGNDLDGGHGEDGDGQAGRTNPME